MAMKFKRGKKKGTSLRLTGLFKTKKRGLFVGSVDADSDQMSGLIDKIKAAKADEKGLVCFLWRNDPDEEGPAYTLSMDVSQDDYEGRPKKKRKPVEDDDDESDEDEEKDEDDEVPF